MTSQPAPSARWRGALDALSAIAFIVLCFVTTWLTVRPGLQPSAAASAASRPAPALRTEPPLPKDPIALVGTAARGNPHATVVPATSGLRGARR